jgi:hypothetical protein
MWELCKKKFLQNEKVTSGRRLPRILKTSTAPEQKLKCAKWGGVLVRIIKSHEWRVGYRVDGD